MDIISALLYGYWTFMYGWEGSSVSVGSLGLYILDKSLHVLQQSPTGDGSDNTREYLHCQFLSGFPFRS